MRGVHLDARRGSPRVSVESFCSEVCDDWLRHALVLDLSTQGLRIQRPVGGPRSRTLQLELEIPGIDEVVWVTGAICFDEVWNVRAASDFRPAGLLRTSGVEIVRTAARHARLLREYVMDTWRGIVRREDPSEALLDASCYLRG